jgi:hypothetical protein
MSMSKRTARLAAQLGEAHLARAVLSGGLAELGAERICARDCLAIVALTVAADLADDDTRRCGSWLDAEIPD